jgi:hypothetical protein
MRPPRPKHHHRGVDSGRAESGHSNGSTLHGVTRKLRCAVYTRKSSEEGLEMEFNSLDAQRERKRKPQRDDYPRPWDERPISIERWHRHRTTLLERSFAGCRPPEWWLYEKGLEPPDRNQAERLYQMNELGEAELAQWMSWWRLSYEDAQQVDSFDTDDARVLEGAAARRAFCREAGIPRAIVKQWDAERKRRAKTIRKLKKVPT